MAQAFVRRGLGVAGGIAAVLAAIWVWVDRGAAPTTLHAPTAAAGPAATSLPIASAAATVSTPASLAASAAAPEALPAAPAEAHRALSVPEWLGGHAPDWRIARLAENPEVLVIEFPDLRDQGEAMNRLAAFVQKADAPRDRVLNPAELATLIAAGGDNSQSFYQGHDYTAADVTRFFDQARAQGLPLTPQESRLQHSLRIAGLLPAGPAPATPPSPAPTTAPDVPLQAVITFTGTQPDDPSTPVDEGVDARRREAVLRHELSHGRFYTQAAYREHCQRFWQEAMTASQRDRLRRFLSGLGYDPRNETLMINEAQAFLMHTPDPRAFSARAAGLSERELADLRAWFWRHQPEAPRR